MPDDLRLKIFENEWILGQIFCEGLPMATQKYDNAATKSKRNVKGTKSPSP